MDQEKTIILVIIPKNNLKVELTEGKGFFSPNKVYRVSLETETVVEKYNFSCIERAIVKFDKLINEYKKGLIG